MLTRASRAIQQRLLAAAGFTQLALRSLANRRSMTLLNLTGIALAVLLLSNAGFFAQAVDRTILQQELAEFSRQTGRNPFSLRIYLFPSSRQPLSLAAAETVAGNLAATLSSEVGLPLRHVGIQVESGSMMMLPDPDDSRYVTSSGYLQSVDLVYVVGVADHISVESGEPLAEPAHQSPLMDVWMHADLAAEMGIAAGETFQLGLNVSRPIGSIRIAGLWRSQDADDPFWFGNPDQSLANALLVPRSSYQQLIEPILDAKSRYAAWHIVLDDRRLNPADAQAYVEGFGHAMSVIDRYLPGARLDVSPLGPLQDFTVRQTRLTIQMLAFNLSALLFLFYFLFQLAQIVVRQQQWEMSILVSRGMSRRSLVWMAALEQGLIFLVAIPLGLAGGLAVARLMGYTLSFLRFTRREPLPVSLQGLDPWLVIAALGLALIVRLAPVVHGASRSLVQHERARARPNEQPFWQRAYVDLLLLPPTVYVYRQLLLQGAFVDPSSEGTDGLLQDPLMVLAPALFIITAALLSMRLFPLAMRLLDRLAGYTPWLTPHLVMRQLGRHSADYTPPLLGVTVLLALGIYTLSMAASLDQWLVDRVYYQAAADARFLPMRATESGGETAILAPDSFDHFSEVIRSARVGDYASSISLAGETLPARFLAVDRLSFPEVVWFRPDFAAEPLGSLMNRLALSPYAILVSHSFLRQHQLQIGDRVPINVNLDSTLKVPAVFTIAGVYTFFPTVYDDEVVVIGSLEAFSLVVGTDFPHEFWLRLRSPSSPAIVYRGIADMGLHAGRWQSAPELLASEQARLERVGIFGTLSVGFGAAVLMAFLALVMHGAASDADSVGISASDRLRDRDGRADRRGGDTPVYTLLAHCGRGRTTAATPHSSSGVERLFSARRWIPHRHDHSRDLAGRPRPAPAPLRPPSSWSTPLSCRSFPS